MLLFPDEADSIIYSVVDLVKVLQSDQVKLTERHAPALYARYLTKQLKRVSPGALPLLELPMASQYDSCLGSGQKPATDSKQWATQDSNELWTDAFAPEASTQALNGSAPPTSANGQYITWAASTWISRSPTLWRWLRTSQNLRRLPRIARKCGGKAHSQWSIRHRANGPWHSSKADRRSPNAESEVRCPSRFRPF